MEIMIVLFILIYLVSFAIYIIICYQDNKHSIYKVGDLIDNIKPFMWCPIANTISLIILGIAAILDLLKLPVLWEKFRNIKLK